jgi:aryl-alcohol dehydrogenase-like predicted oxidoreductase
MPEVFGILDDLVQDGKLRFYGCERRARRRGAARGALSERPVDPDHLQHVPAQAGEELFPVVREKQIGILARVPLASGLLSGKLRPDSTFAATDHRNYNRHGESFDVGETFSGVDYDAGIQAVEELRALVPPDATMAQLALRWILMFPEVTAAIPGARDAGQTDDNVRAASLPPLSEDVMTHVREVYDRSIRPLVHDRW